MKLETYIARKKITIAAFAKRIGTSSEAVRRYCKGERIPRLFILRKIIEETGGEVGAGDFLGLPEGAPEISGAGASRSAATGPP